MQFRFLSSLCISIAMLLLANSTQAQLIVDTTLSQATITVAGLSDTSTTSGTIDLQVSPSTTLFSTAQITDLNLTLDEALFLNFGLASLATDPASIQIEMISPGAAGSVAGGTFDQLGNTLAVSGQADVTDPFGLVGGSMLIDLSALGSQAVDFNNISIVEAGGVVTVDASYSIIGAANGVDVSIDGRVVASGPVVAVPEPTTAGIIGAATCFVFLRRRRS